MFWSRLRQRHLQPELMDQPGLDEEQHRVALRALERINRLSFSARIFWPPLERLARRLHPQPCRILDMATGGGDVVRGLWRKAQRAKLAFHFEGCDISSTALALAEQKCRDEGAEVRFFVRDIFAEQLPAEYDAIITSLFLHHLDEEKAIELLRRMAGAARCLVLVNDLERGRLGYLLAWMGTRLLTRSHIVHVDGPRSVEGAFTMCEALGLAHRAGLEGALIGWRWPCRYLLSWERPGAFA